VATRSVIARPTPEGGFCGTYCHYDGYPAHQGRLLHGAVGGQFDGDPDAACRYLIDQHPARENVNVKWPHRARQKWPHFPGRVGGMSRVSATTECGRRDGPGGAITAR
jgi:hypothetical protein